MKDLALSIFRNAQVYEKASRVLREAGAHDFSLLLPGNVNAALSLELYFKALNILEHGVEFKIKGRHSHHFGQLFQELGAATKIRLNELFKAAVSKMDPNEIPHLESAIGGVIPKDLKTNLVEWAALFADLRYAHSFIEKYKGKRVAMAFYPQIVESVVGHILEQEPDWAS